MTKNVFIKLVTDYSSPIPIKNLYFFPFYKRIRMYYQFLTAGGERALLHIYKHTSKKKKKDEGFISVKQARKLYFKKNVKISHL